MDQRQIKTVRAFTILEVTIVLAILSILITIITTTLNRFNEQLKINRDIQEELSDWMLIRSNLWNEYYSSDSVYTTGKELFFYQPYRTVCYKIDENSLKRTEIKNITISDASTSEEWIDLKVAISSIREDSINKQKRIIMTFPLKGDDMELYFSPQKNKNHIVNQYYEQLINE